MDQLKQSGTFTIDDGPLAKIRAEFTAGRCNEDETIATMAKHFEKSGYTLDPHTAIGVKVAEKLDDEGALNVTLGTAHPAKFPVVTEKATGQWPQLPHYLSDLMEREEDFTVLPNDLDVLQAHISKLTRAKN